MPNVSLTGIEFTIKGSADKASASVDSLIQKLSNLNAALSSGANAQAFAKGLESIAKAANSLSGTNVAGAQSALEQLSKSMESFKSFGDSLKGVATFGNAMSKLAAKPENLMQVAEILAKIATIDFTNIKEAGEGLRNIATAANSLAKIPQATKETGDAAKKANSPLKTFLKSLGRIAFYRIIRGILKSITSAFREGLKNAYQFDKIAGGQLAQSLDRLATTSLTMKNQLGAAFGQLLVALTPVIVGIIKLVTALASAITRLIAILGGSSQWLKAKDVWTEWGDAAEGAGGAAKEALKYLAPFDELNVLPSQRSGGGGGGGDNYGDMFEWVDTDVGSGFLDSITEAFSKLADWFEGKDWQDIGYKAWDKLSEIFQDVSKANECVNAFMESIGAAFGAISATAFGFLRGFVEDLVIQFKKNLEDYDGDGIDFFDVLSAIFKTGNDIERWVSDNLLTPFITGFVEAFTGEQLTDDMENALSDMISALWDTSMFLIFKRPLSDDTIAWLNENVLNPLIRWYNSTLLPKINDFIQGINDRLDTINAIFGTSYHIDLLGEIQEIEVKVPESKRKVTGVAAVVTKLTDSMEEAVKEVFVTASATKLADAIKDPKTINNVVAWITGRWNKIPNKDRYLTNFTAWITGRGNKIPQKERYLDKFTAWITGRLNKIPQKERYLDKFTAWLTGVVNKVPEKDRTISGITAGVTKMGTSMLDAASRTVDSVTAIIKYQQDGLNKTQKTLDGMNANLTSATNNIPTAQLSLESTAAVVAKVIKVSLQDPNTGNLQLDATAHISRITGQTTVPIPFDNGIAGGMSASGGVRYSIESGDNEEVLYRAMSRALADSELGGDIELDGEVLYKRMVNRNRANTRLTGVNAMA